MWQPYTEYGVHREDILEAAEVDEEEGVAGMACTEFIGGRYKWEVVVQTLGRYSAAAAVAAATVVVDWNDFLKTALHFSMSNRTG